MNPLITIKETGIGRVEIETRQLKTVYKHEGFSHEGLNWLTDEVNLALNLKIEECETLRRHYAAAMRERTPLELMSELGDLGVTAKFIEFPCQGDNCKETAVEEVDAPQRIDEVAGEAEYACDFEDGLCQSCYFNEQQEIAEELAGRAQQEAREEMG